MFNTFGNTNPYAAQLQDLQRQLSSLQNTMPAQLQPVPQFQPAAIPQIPTVHGYEGIKAYYVPQSGSVVALDADSDDDKVIFYVKVMDSNGVATIKAYDGYERVNAEVGTESQYVLKSDFDKLAKKLEELSTRVVRPAAIDFSIVPEEKVSVTEGGEET